MKRLNAFSAIIGGLLVFCIMILLSAEIIGRKMGCPIPGTIEIAGFALAGIVFLGLSKCEEVHEHVRVEFLLVRYPPALRRWAEIFINLLGIFVYGIMTWQTTVEAISSWATLEVVPGLIPLPVYPAKTIVSIGCAMISVQLIINAWKWVDRSHNRDSSQLV